MIHDRNFSIRRRLIYSFLFVIALGLWRFIPNPSSPVTNDLQKNAEQEVVSQKASSPAKTALTQTTAGEAIPNDETVSVTPSDNQPASTAVDPLTAPKPFAKAEVISSRDLPLKPGEKGVLNGSRWLKPILNIRTCVL